ncbi:hypothetical protein OAF98_03180 [Planctomicrobium sp.]|nr:hypothetical protein [Planctomicrobium sp.]
MLNFTDQLAGLKSLYTDIPEFRKHSGFPRRCHNISCPQELPIQNSFFEQVRFPGVSF